MDYKNLIDFEYNLNEKGLKLTMNGIERKSSKTKYPVKLEDKCRLISDLIDHFFMEDTRKTTKFRLNSYGLKHFFEFHGIDDDLLEKIGIPQFKFYGVKNRYISNGQMISILAMKNIKIDVRHDTPNVGVYIRLKPQFKHLKNRDKIREYITKKYKEGHYLF